MAAPGGPVSVLPEMLAQRSPCVQVHTSPGSLAPPRRDAPAAETLPSALLTGHFYYLGYLKRLLACCLLFAVLGEGKSRWSKWTL